MLSNAICILITVAGFFISSVESAAIRICDNDEDFLFKAKQSLGETVGIIVTREDQGFPTWMREHFEKYVNTFLVITHSPGGSNFANILKFLKILNYPTLVVVRNGFRLKRKLVSCLSSEIDAMLNATLDPHPQLGSETRLTDEFEEFLNSQLEAQSTSGPTRKLVKNMLRNIVRNLEGSTSRRTEGSSNLGRQNDTGLNLNEPASMEDHSFRLFGTNLQTNANDNVHKKKLSSGGEIAPSAQVIWLFGEPYTYDAPSGGLSKSPPTQIVSSSGRQSMSPPAPTGPNSRKHSISPPAPGGSSKGKQLRSPSLPPQKKSKNY